MTNKVIINHDENKLINAYGINEDDFPKKIALLITEYLNGGNDKMSSLGDVIQKNLKPNEILYLAQLSIISKLEQIEDDMESMDKLIKKLGL